MYFILSLSSHLEVQYIAMQGITNDTSPVISLYLLLTRPEDCPLIDIRLVQENKLATHSRWLVPADSLLNIWNMELLGEDFIPEEDKL